MIKKANRLFWDFIYGLTTGAIFGALAGGFLGASSLYLIPSLWEMAQDSQWAEWGMKMSGFVGEEIGQNIGKAITGGLFGASMGAGLGCILGAIRKMFYAD